MKLHKGDQVKIRSGKDRGKVGTISRVFPGENRVVVDGVNLVKKRVRPQKQGMKGETVLVPRPLAASKLLPVCRSCKEPTRVGYRIEGSEKIRICKKCGATL